MELYLGILLMFINKLNVAVKGMWPTSSQRFQRSVGADPSKPYNFVILQYTLMLFSPQLDCIMATSMHTKHKYLLYLIC